MHAYFRVDLWRIYSPSSTREASLAHFYVFIDPCQTNRLSRTTPTCNTWSLSTALQLLSRNQDLVHVQQKKPTNACRAGHYVQSERYLPSEVPGAAHNWSNNFTISHFHFPPQRARSPRQISRGTAGHRRGSCSPKPQHCVLHHNWLSKNETLLGRILITQRGHDVIHFQIPRNLGPPPRQRIVHQPARIHAFAWKPLRVQHRG